MSSVLISIIVPTYNKANLLSETLNSVKNQTYTQWECIVVDDGSTENNVKVENEFSKNDSRFSVYERKDFTKNKCSHPCQAKSY